MTITTGASSGDAVRHADGPFSHMMKRLIAARELRARQQVSGHIRSLDDATLAIYGIDRRSISQGFDRGYPS